MGKVCFIGDNATSANGALKYSKFRSAESFFISLSPESSDVFSREPVDFIEKGVVRHKPNSYKRSSLVRYALFIRRVLYPLVFINLSYYFRRFYRHNSIGEVVVGGDRSHANGYFMPALHAARSIGIKIVIVEYADFADEERLVAVRRAKKQFIRVTPLARILFPQYIVLCPGEGYILLYPVSLLLLWRVMGCLSSNPLVVGTSLGTLVVVRYQATLNRLIRGGVPKDNISVVPNFFYEENGHPVSVKEAVSYDIAIALPQLYEHDLCSKKEANQYHKNIFSVLKDADLKSVVLLHPKMDRQKYHKFIAPFGLEVFNGSSYSAIKKSRCLVSTYSSLTHDAYEEGLICHVYDPMNFRYSMFSDYIDCTYSYSMEEFELFIKKLQGELYG